VTWLRGQQAGAAAGSSPQQFDLRATVGVVVHRDDHQPFDGVMAAQRRSAPPPRVGRPYRDEVAVGVALSKALKRPARQGIGHPDGVERDTRVSKRGLARDPMVEATRQQDGVAVVRRDGVEVPNRSP
jgi:hypothetical protein